MATILTQDEFSELPQYLKKEYRNACKLATNEGTMVYRLTGDRYFPNDGFMSESQVIAHIKWWEQQDGGNHDDMWDSVTEFYI
jgi:hypothetical protein